MCHVTHLSSAACIERSIEACPGPNVPKVMFLRWVSCANIFIWYVYLIVLCDHPTLFPYFLLFCYPYTLLHFKCFFITCLCHFSVAGTCPSWGLPSHSSRSLSQAAADICTIDLGISYTGSIGWRITGPSVLSNTEFDGLLHWVNPSMDEYYPCFLNAWICGYPRSLDREIWLCNTSLNHSDTFISMVGTYLSLSKCLVRLTTQRILCFFDPMPRYMANWLNF